MSFSIQGTPVQINLLFVPLDGAAPLSPHLLGAPSEALLLDLILGLLPQDAATALGQLLSSPVDQYFDQAWAGLQVSAQGRVNEAIQSAISNAYNVSTSLPAKGSLVADVGGLSAVMQETIPVGACGTQLTFQYLLPGVQVSFSETTGGIWGSWADPNYNLTFDLALEIAVAVPAKAATSFGTKAQLLVTNMQAGPRNLYALIGGLEDLIGAFLTGQPGGQGAALSDRIIGIYIAQLAQLFTPLSMGFAVASSNGFTDLSVMVNTNPAPDTLPDGVTPGNQVEFDLQVPFVALPPPVSAYKTGSIPLTPAIETSAPEVSAAASLGVQGTGFPPAQATQLSITWDDVQYVPHRGDPLPGSIVESEVQWGVATGGASPPPRHGERRKDSPRRHLRRRQCLHGNGARTEHALWLPRPRLLPPKLPLLGALGCCA